MAILPVIELGSLWVNDVPTSPMRADFVDETGNTIELALFTGFSAKLLSPAGIDLETTLDLIAVDDHLDVTWPVTTQLEEPGIYQLIFTMFGSENVELQAEPYRFVVQAVDGWLTLEQARSLWADAPLDDVFLALLLDTAKEQCVAYAPALLLGAVVPARYSQAQLTQARALYQSTIANQNDNVGIEGFTVRVFPLDFTIRAMLRPKKAVGGMF